MTKEMIAEITRDKNGLLAVPSTIPV